MSSKKKHPSQKVNPQNQQTPRGISKAQKTEEANLVWNMEIIDCDGPWCWKDIDPRTWWNYLCPAKRDFSTMKWSEILGDRHHRVFVSDIIRKAQDRLVEIEQSDIDQLYSLAISGDKRIWGIRDRHIFKVLWWDPKHEICPSLLRHT